MKAPNKPRILPPQGTFPARVYRIVYLGTVKGEYKGVPNESAKVSITWELPTKTHVFKEGEPAKPFSMSKMVSHSMGKKSSLRPIVEGMLGVAFTDEEAYGYDLDEIMGMPCLLGIAYQDTPDGQKAIIKSYSQIPEGMTCPPAINSPKILSYSNWDQSFFESLPQWMRDEMMKTPEYIKMTGGVIKDELDHTENIDPDSIPF